jgi:hypothetical protein
MHRMLPTLVTAGLIYVLSPTVDGEAPPPTEDSKKADESEAAKARLKTMMDALGEYTIEIDGADETQTPKLLPAPALRWTNTISGTKDGVVAIWSTGGRPDVIAQFSGGGSVWVHEFCSTSARTFAMKRPGWATWSPKVAGVTLRAVPKAPIPAETSLNRLAQMRKIAERFEVVDDFRPIYQEPKTERHTLRLLPKPIYRYEAADDIVDGAVFALVITTDPEALLMIEAGKTDKGVEWRYAVARMTVYALTATLDGAEVWSQPEKLAGQWRRDEPYCVGLHR